MTHYRYTDATNSVVHVIDDDGVSRKSCLVEDIADWLAAGNLPDPFVPTPEQVAAATLAVTDASAVTAAKANLVIKYLATHTPTECAAYVTTNVTDLPSAKAMLANFAVALSVLVRQQLR